ncbi:MAG: hypothetical protein HRT87_04725 [Legionellales bacterium]|nr:hypothetical protein [Legionellales bacterium]
MKLSEHINWAVKNSEFTNPKEIRNDLLNNHGIEVTISEIEHIQNL